jgi:capsular exopolysaccharide synthesis family protein
MNDPSNSQNPWQPTSRQKKFNLQVVWIALRCWWHIALPVGLLMASGAVAWLWYSQVDTYTASACLQIKEKPDVILRDVQLESHRFLQNQLAILQSRRILGPLTSNPDIISAPELLNHSDAVLVIAKGLRIRQRKQSDLYDISYSGRSPKQAKLIIDEVVNSYLTFNRMIESENDNRIIALLEEQRAARYEEMNQLRENVRTLSVQLTGIDPFKVETDEDKVKTQSLLDSLRAEVVRYQVAQDILAEQIKREEEAQNEESVELSQAEIDVQVRSQAGYVALQARIEALERKLDDYNKTTKKEDTNQSYKQLKNDLAAATASLEKFKTQSRGEIEQTMKKQLLATKAEKLGVMKNNFIAGDARLKVLKDKLAVEEKAKNEEEKPPGYSLELEFRKAKLEQVTKMHNEIQARILAIKTEQKAPDRVKLFEESVLPTKPDNNSVLMKMLAAAGGLFMFPFGLALLWEHVYRRVNNRHEVEETQHIPVIGEVTALPTKRRKTPLRDRSNIHDYGLFEESVESVRTCLSLMSSLKDMQTLCVMSAVSGEGKTSLAAQLAICIARATDDRTLLIDGDMRAPDMHGIFQVEQTPGLAEVLGSECPIGEAIEVDVAKNLHLMTGGKLKCSPHQLLNANEFATLLKKLKKHYRYIVIDTPPILPASESLVMARAADAAVLCMRRDHSRVDQSQDAYGRMLAAGVKVAGAVLNGISTRQYYYRYGNYQYRITHSSKEPLKNSKEKESSVKSKPRTNGSAANAPPAANPSNARANGNLVSASVKKA